MVSDIQKVLTAVESVGSSPNPEYSAAWLISTLDATATTRMRETQSGIPEITSPLTPPIILPSTSGSSFSIEIIARSYAPTTISSASCDGITPPNGLPSPEPTPSSKRPRSGSNNNQLSQTTHHISSMIQSPMQSPVHSCRQSPALPDTGEPQPSPRSPLPQDRPRTPWVDSNEGDIDPNELRLWH
ncbi:hypothetical protein B9Z19DRAFT_1061713 [Tuber borchii]|uniref:Uncharacterized protein n=1 Tax=Tuber borchii TaxID=42251 RepID=A0A2T7A4J2_TUBBO|nr:hypothetical protein B9Z19DRAFT_1061713 [Tuber borchii]